MSDPTAYQNEITHLRGLVEFWKGEHEQLKAEVERLKSEKATWPYRMTFAHGMERAAVIAGGRGGDEAWAIAAAIRAEAGK